MDDPTAFFVVSTMIICLSCLAILVPVFLPKWLQRHAEEPKGRSANDLFSRRKSFNWRWSSRTSAVPSSHSNGILETLQSEFLESKPQKIKRVASNSTVKTSSSSSTNFQRPSIENNPVYRTISKGPAMVSKAILLAGPKMPSNGSSTAESLPSRLGVVMEGSVNDTSHAGEDELGVSKESNP